MSDKISLEDAYRILADVRPEQCFWVNNGPILRNIHEIYDAIAYMKDETLRHHINDEKNDFSNWVRDVLKDGELADSLSRAKSREKILKKIKSRIKFLEEKIEEESSRNQA